MPKIAFSLSKITSKNNLARLFLFLEVKIALQGYLLFFALKDATEGRERPPLLTICKRKVGHLQEALGGKGAFLGCTPKGPYGNTAFWARFWAGFWGRGFQKGSEKVACYAQRAQRSKKFDLDRNFQSRSKFLISLENFNLDVSIAPQKIGPRWVARSKISFSIEIFNLDRNLESFWSLGPLGGFCSKQGFWEGFSEGVLRRQFPEGA